MALTLQTIFHFTETPFKLKLLAGKNGMTKVVSWVFYTEDSSTIEYIRGGELAVTLGVSYERSRDNLGIKSDDYIYDFLKDFIDKFILHNATGLIINTGKYITEIPQSIIDYCNEKDFPLFSMPWEIHTIDLMQEVGNMISSDNQNNDSLEKYFYRGIFDLENFDPKQIENTIFNDAKCFSILLIELDETLFNNNMGKIKRYVNLSLNPRISLTNKKFISFIHKHNIIYVIADSDLQFVNEVFAIVRSDRYFKDSLISVSDNTADIGQLPKIYEHASVAMEIDSSGDKVNFYDDLGTYKILVAVKDKKVLKDFYDETLGKLDFMEPEKKNDFIKTLSLYLKSGGNVLKVAEQNNAHRNTIVYRLNRLEEIIGQNISDGEVRTKLQLALYIKKLLQRDN